MHAGARCCMPIGQQVILLKLTDGLVHKWYMADHVLEMLCR